jgi:hypothetical protein
VATRALPPARHRADGTHLAVDPGRPRRRRWARQHLATARTDLRRRPRPHLRPAGHGDRRRLRPLGPLSPAPVRARRDQAHRAIEWDEEPEGSLPSDSVRLSRLQPDEQFTYTFDLGDDWTHLCTVADSRIDPLDTLGIVPNVPLPYWGWGSIPDQYGRRFDGDDGETPIPPDPNKTDLPPLRPWWGTTRP